MTREKNRVVKRDGVIAIEIAVIRANVTNGAGNIYENNTITAIKVDDEVQVSGIMPGSKDALVLWRTNTIISDQYGIVFGGYPTYSFNSRFENTRFVKGANARSDYSVLAYDPKVSSQAISGTVFHNTTLEGGGTLRTIASPWYPPAAYSVTSSLNLTL